MARASLIRPEGYKIRNNFPPMIRSQDPQDLAVTLRACNSSSPNSSLVLTACYTLPNSWLDKLDLCDCQKVSMWANSLSFGCLDTKQTNILRVTISSSRNTTFLTPTPFLRNTLLPVVHVFRPHLNFGCVLMAQYPHMHGS